MKKRRNKRIPITISKPGVLQIVLGIISAAALAGGYYLIADKSAAADLLPFYAGMFAMCVISTIFAMTGKYWGWTLAMAASLALSGHYLWQSQWWTFYQIVDMEEFQNTTNVLLTVTAVMVILQIIFAHVDDLSWKAKLSLLIPLGFVAAIWAHTVKLHASAEGVLHNPVIMVFAVFVMISVHLVNIFLYVCGLTFDVRRVNYDTYTHNILRGYRFTAFAKQTGLKKREVADKSGADVQTRGNFGEYEAYWALNKFLPGKKKFLFGAVIPEPDGSFQEIDVLCFWRNCIIVCEAKNYSGEIIEDVNSREWKLKTPGGVVTTGNPYLQNWQHRMALSWYLDKGGIYKSDMLVSLNYFVRKFSDITTLRTPHDVRFNNVPHTFTTVSVMQSFVDEISKSGTSFSTAEDVKKAYELLDRLPKYTKQELEAKTMARSMSSNVRAQTSRKEVYHFDETHRQMYRSNQMYTEILRVAGTEYLWDYYGETGRVQLPSDAVVIDNPRLQYVLIDNFRLPNVTIERNGKPIDIRALAESVYGRNTE